MGTATTYVAPNQNGGAVNKTDRPNYHIEVNILDSTLTAINSSPLKYVPNQVGLLTVDFASAIGGFMSDPKEGLFSFLYSLEVLEVWGGSSESPVTTTELQAVLAKKQLLQTGGANMWEFLLRESSTGTSGVPGRFLTEFQNPLMWLQEQISAAGEDAD